MAFRTNASNDTLDAAFRSALGIASQIRRRAVSLDADSAAGDVSILRILRFMDDLQAADDRLAAVQGLSGVVAYAQAEYDDGAYDVATEFMAMRTAIAATVTWIDTNAPKAADGAVKTEDIVSGRLVQRQLSSVQTAGLRTELVALIATIAAPA